MAAADPTWLVRSGTTEVRRHSLAQVDPEQYSELAQWRTDQRVVALASAAERRRYPQRWDGGALVERLTLGGYSEPNDDTELHIDTFFDTHSCGYILTT